VKALIFSWIEPSSKDSKNHQQNLLSRVVASYDFPKTTPGMQVKRLTFNPKDNN
jgi:hypothetical protein